MFLDLRNNNGKIDLFRANATSHACGNASANQHAPMDKSPVARDS
jgi:hypothetical protein